MTTRVKSEHENELEKAIENLSNKLEIDMLPGGTSRHPSNYDVHQLRRGLLHELEHTSDPLIALQIAMDHLEEDAAYYDKLALIEDDVPPDVDHGAPSAEGTPFDADGGAPPATPSTLEPTPLESSEAELVAAARNVSPFLARQLVSAFKIPRHALTFSENRDDKTVSDDKDFFDTFVVTPEMVANKKRTMEPYLA